MFGLELGGVESVGGWSGVGSSEECDIGVRLPDVKEDDVGGCKEDAANADWQTEGAVKADWCRDGAKAEFRTELVPKAEE